MDNSIANPMTDHEKHTNPDCTQKHRAYELLDKPVENPRYGGITLRQAVLRLRRPIKSKPQSSR